MVRVFWFPSGLQYAKRMGLNPVLDRASILFIKSEFHCGRFAPLWNSSNIHLHFVHTEREDCTVLHHANR